MTGGKDEMIQEFSTPTKISIKDKKHLTKGNVIRSAVFARSKVIEVLTAENERYYFIYYKNSLVYGDKLDKVEDGTFISKVYSNGVVIESPHPLLTALIPNLSVSIPNKNKLFTQLQVHYSHQEIAYIATTLDSFFEKEQLIKIIDKVYFHFRRDGKFMKSFQVIQTLSEFSPALAKDRLHSQEFHSYHDYYNSSSLPDILKKDPLYVELQCFKNRFNPDNRQFLIEILRADDPLLVLLLWLEEIKKLQKTDSIEKYTAIALRFVTMEDWMRILGQVNINPFRELPSSKSIIEKMIQKGNFEQAALSLLNFIGDLPSSYDAILSEVWENSDSKFIIAHLEEFITLLQQLPEGEKLREFEQRIFQIVVILLEKQGLHAVHEKLLPIQKLLPDSEVIQKINKMSELVEDPDRMMDLGDYYAEFKQYDKAIDCFFWEMELEPQNPSPVWKISKMYQYKGMTKEASAYQKIYSQLKSNQETG
jgi:tetratricopeptide (TPR) repeat protein